MFTGLISDIGEVLAAEHTGSDIHLRIRTAYALDQVALGASIACDGICLTVTEKGDDWFAVTASTETANVTTLAHWRAGTRINLERSLKVGDELGGHFVSGHVDGVGRITNLAAEGASWHLICEIPADLLPYMARKGSVAIDGISLTINHVDDPFIHLMIIPHTYQHTALQYKAQNDQVNLEIDLIARYSERLMNREQPHG